MNKKVMFITGAGSGIGQLAAQRALDAGWKVAAFDVNQDGLNKLGDRAELLKLVANITDPAAVEDAVARAELELGPIDRLCNAAGIMPLGLLNDQPGNVIHKIMAINYGGLVNITKSVLPRMIARRSGEFVSYSSIAGHWPVIYMGAYNASKAAVATFTEVLYHENRNSGVRFACVCPPTVATPLLKQAEATVWPKLLDQFAPITSDEVLDAVERGLANGTFWIFPGPVTAMAWRMRRWFPRLMWWHDHRVEGR